MRKFVIACTYICNRILTIRNVEICGNYLKQFCVSFERLYGKQLITPNMHLHCHLVDCIYDYGPVYSFWLFSFERYNGLLGKIPSNKRGIEIQFMKRFTRESVILSRELPMEGREMFEPLIKSTCAAMVNRGSLIETLTSNYGAFHKSASRFTDIASVAWSLEETSSVRFSGKKIQFTFSDMQIQYLKRCYESMYPNLHSRNCFYPLSCWRGGLLYIHDEMYGSVGSRNNRSCHITAYWCGNDGSIQRYNDMYLTPRPGRICNFFSHILYVDGNPLPHIFADVEWFLPMGDEKRYKFGKPVEVWSSELFERPGSASFIPVQRIKSKFLQIKFKIDCINVMAVVPRNRAMNI